MSTAIKFPEPWPPAMPDEIQLYSMATPNGQKVSIALEEMGLPYEAHLVDITKGEQQHPDYLELSPNGKIPAILDPCGPEEKSVILMESIAILIYLADKSGQLLPQNYLERINHLQWLFFQAAHIGPMFGQFGHFYLFDESEKQNEYSVTRYSGESKRLLKILDERLQGRHYIMDEYSIVDIAIAPWVDCLDNFYHARDALELDSFIHVRAWLERVSSRPAYQAGSNVCMPGLNPSESETEAETAS